MEPGHPQHVQCGQQEEMRKSRERDLVYSAPAKEAAPPAARPSAERVGRNDPCPCGSGKKYKKCHGTEEKAGAGPRPTAPHGMRV